MTTTKQSWLKRSLAVLLAVIMVMSMGVADVFAAEEKCPTPEVYNLGATFSLEGYLLSGFVRAGVDINKNGGTGTSGYTYYYTTDGSIPSADNPNAETNGRRDYVMMRNVSSAVVDGVITYKVVATKDGMEDSDVLTYELKISDGRPTFTDASLKSAVMKALGKSGDISTPLTEEEMLELTELSAPSAGITDLAGLEFALNLETLDLSGNDLAETIGDFATAIRNDPFAKLITLNLSNCNLGADDPSLNSNLRRALANLPNLETLNLSDNSLYGVFSLTGGTEEPLSYANLETLDLSSNDLSGITYTSNADFSSLKKIDLSDNRVYLNENAGDWYEKAMEIGLEKIDVSDQKSLTELRGVHILGQTNDFELSYIDNKNNTINLGSALDSTVTFKLQGWGEWQTMSGSLTDDDMPFMIATPSTEADAEDTCFITKELSLGENTFEIILTHVSGETRTYTATIMRSGLPTSDDPDSAGIQDATLQKLVVEALNELSEYEDAPLDYTTHVVTKQEMEKLKTLNGSGEKVTDISGLQYATNLTQLQLYGDFTEVDVSPFTHLTRLVLEGNFTEVDGLSSVTDITSLSLNGSFTTAPDISALTALTSLTVSVAEDLTIPDLKTLSNLRTLNITNCIDGFRWEETSLPRLNQVQLSDCSNTVQIPAFSTDNSRITWNVTTDGTSALVLDVSNLQAATSNTILTVGGTQNSIPSDKITIRGKNNAITTLNFQYVSEIAYDDFSSDSLLNLVFNYVSDISVPQNAVVPNVDNLSGQNSSTKDGAWKTEFNQMTSLNSIALTFSGLTSLKNFDLSQCANLTSLNLSSSTYLQDTLYGERLPSSLETLNLQNTKVDLAGDWTNMKALQNLTLTNTGIYEFPSAVVRQLPTLASLLATSNYYTFIPENTFENSSNLKTLQLGSWIPVIQKDNNIWEIDPDSETGKAIEKLREVSEDVSITNTVSTTGSYSTLIALDSDIGEVEGDPITQTSLTLMVPTETSSVTLLPTALLKDTVITIEGREYRDGEAIVIPIQEQTTVVELHCYNEATNQNELNKERDYTLTISLGQYLENFQPEEGKVYQIPISLQKITGSSSMAADYFFEQAEVRYEGGQYDIRFSTIAPNLITDMKYGEGGQNGHAADVTGGDGITTREYRIYANSLEEAVPITPQVVPMSNNYATCYMHFDLTKVLDITDTVGSDKADLNAAINAAIAITEKRNVYTDDSWENFMEKLEEAQAIAELSAPTQSAVDEAAEALVKAMTVGGEGGLVIDESKLANKTALETAINEAKALQQGNHTATAWNALQGAIADAQTVYDTLEASQTEVDTAAKSLNTAVTLFQNSGEASELDKNNLEDGVYSVYGEMIKLNRIDKSMSNDAINHTIKLTVEDGKYYLNMDFHGLAYLNKFGYLAELSYYDNGYTYGQYGTVEGRLIPATVLSTQKNADGSDLYDEFNQAGGSYEGKLYPDQIQFPLVAGALADADGYVPLHVFVPVMEDISAGTGDQDVLLKLDWSTLTKTTEDDPNFEPEEPVEQSPAVDFTDSATGVKVHADKGVFDEGVQIVVSEITQGADYDAAVSSLSDVGKKFKLYDVKFLDAEGNEVTPNGTVSISFPIAAGYDSANLAVYRLADGGKVLVRGAVENGYYTVITRTAGTYALVEKGSTITDAENTENVNNDNQNQSDNTTSPQTGDSSNIAVYALLALAAAGMMGVTLVTRKRKSEEA